MSLESFPMSDPLPAMGNVVIETSLVGLSDKARP